MERTLDQKPTQKPRPSTVPGRLRASQISLDEWARLHPCLLLAEWPCSTCNFFMLQLPCKVRIITPDPPMSKVHWGTNEIMGLIPLVFRDLNADIFTILSNPMVYKNILDIDWKHTKTGVWGWWHPCKGPQMKGKWWGLPKSYVICSNNWKTFRKSWIRWIIKCLKRSL